MMDHEHLQLSPTTEKYSVSAISRSSFKGSPCMFSEGAQNVGVFSYNHLDKKMYIQGCTSPRGKCQRTHLGRGFEALIQFVRGRRCSKRPSLPS